VDRLRQAEEGGVRARFSGDDAHPERRLVELKRALQAGDEQDSVVLLRSTSGDDLGAAGPAIFPSAVRRRAGCSGPIGDGPLGR
jgi:hypothetical protein